MGNLLSTAGTDTLDDIPNLIGTMLSSKGPAPRANAAHRVYILCDVGHKQNRVPLVCSGTYDILTPLVHCLNGRGAECKAACLALNNLSIPPENKRVMASSKDVIGGLCKTVAENSQESYLCCICLMNLSFLEASRRTILQHSPSPDHRNIPPLDNPDSLLRVLERLLTTNSNRYEKTSENTGLFRGRVKASNTDAVRWACGLLKNLSNSKDNATLIGQTDIPKCVVEYIRASTSSASFRWTNNSLEDFSLFIVLNLAKWPESRDALSRADAIGVIQPILVTAEGDFYNDTIQGLKATMACAFLNGTGGGVYRWHMSPIARKAAEGAVAELVTNIQTGRDKKGQYAHSVFTLDTATKAYDIIMPCTNLAERKAAHVHNLQDKHARALQDLRDKHKSELRELQQPLL